jgi:hypothetical protein
MAKNRKQNVVTILLKEVHALEAEEVELRKQLADLQSVIRDIRQAVLTLEGTAVHLPLSAKVIDMIQATNRFLSASEIAELMVKKEEFLDLRTLKRDVNSVLNRMKKKGLVVSIEHERVLIFGLSDWVDAKMNPLEAYKPKAGVGAQASN